MAGTIAEPEQRTVGIRRHIPNLLTTARLVLAVVFFCLLAVSGRASQAGQPVHGLLLNGAFGIFLVAVGTDFLDGHLARKWNVVSVFGRIADPFVDKIIILGAFVLLIPLMGSVLEAWMVVVILGRELLISAIRGFAESQGISFAASMHGKLKFWSQCMAVGACLIYLGIGRGNATVEWLTVLLVWAALAFTVGSGLAYLSKARRLLKNVSAPSG